MSAFYRLRDSSVIIRDTVANNQSRLIDLLDLLANMQIKQSNPVLSVNSPNQVKGCNLLDLNCNLIGNIRGLL
jgi:hypothetical protein